MRVAFRSVVSISFFSLVLLAFAFDAAADGTNPTVYPSACGPNGNRVCGTKCCGTAYGGGEPPLYCCGLGMSMAIYCDEQKVHKGTEYEASLLDECPSGHDCLTVMVGSQTCYYDAPTCESHGYSSTCTKVDILGLPADCDEDDKVQTPEGRTCYINDEEEPELEQVCQILPEQTPTGTGHNKCCKETASPQTCPAGYYNSLEECEAGPGINRPANSTYTNGSGGCKSEVVSSLTCYRPKTCAEIGNESGKTYLDPTIAAIKNSMQPSSENHGNYVHAGYYEYSVYRGYPVCIEKRGGVTCSANKIALFAIG